MIPLSASFEALECHAFISWFFSSLLWIWRRGGGTGGRVRNPVYGSDPSVQHLELSRSNDRIRDERLRLNPHEVFIVDIQTHLVDL